MDELERQREEQEFNEVLMRLEDAAKIEAWLAEPEWEPLRKAWKQTYELGLSKLQNTSPYNDPAKITELQIFCHFYTDIPKTIEMYRQLGKEAYETAKERGWLDRISGFLQP